MHFDFEEFSAQGFKFINTTLYSKTESGAGCHLGFSLNYTFFVCKFHKEKEKLKAEFNKIKP